MSDDTHKMYEDAKRELNGLLKQQEEIKQKIANWAPVVEHLAILCDEPISDEISSLASQAGHDLGLSDAIRWVFENSPLASLTAIGVRDGLASIGYNLKKYASVMPPIHNTLKRMKDAGEIEEAESFMGTKKGYRLKQARKE